MPHSPERLSIGLLTIIQANVNAYYSDRSRATSIPWLKFWLFIDCHAVSLLTLLSLLVLLV